MPFSSSLFSAVIVQLLCQLFKVVFYSIKDRRLSFSYFFSAGRMPSAHTAFVTALTVSVGLANGFRSEFFTIAFVFSTIIVYDIVRVRGAVQANSRILAEIVEKMPGAEPPMESREEGIEISHMVGHTLGEVIVGFVVGAGLAAAFYYTGIFSP
jgi:acid phosphatase family membrane protein YuiD